MKKDYGHALADIREVLTREPRHFGALSGLGLILQEIGDDKHALEAYRRALAIDPHLEHIDDVVKTLREKVEGRDLDSRSLFAARARLAHRRGIVFFVERKLDHRSPRRLHRFGAMAM